MGQDSRSDDHVLWELRASWRRSNSALLEEVYHHDGGRGGWCSIEVTPRRDFVTYGIGVSLWAMRSPERARARVAVEAD